MNGMTNRYGQPLRTGVQMESMATPYGRQLVVRGVLPVPVR